MLDPAHRLFPLGDGTWAGFMPWLVDGDPYLFWVRGPEMGTEGVKRDPYARELGTQPPFPNCPCLLREAHAYPWHDARWHAFARALVIGSLTLSTIAHTRAENS